MENPEEPTLVKATFSVKVSFEGTFGHEGLASFKEDPHGFLNDVFGDSLDEASLKSQGFKVADTLDNVETHEG